ncbi:uncharacterized protein CTHT_0033630 [Thermochaetoides thermophila DSM 1495]|uniref:Uncharacterized protein n=1 Tax=Chaetomium thermophilum (strain DSM 1495 / CBS 144.50 / IMI 039719) TaxID=759272 RepID=G0S5U3_CHATD|nr:hypothetical protein CTHT_0033630 [Thermochaetoides thermophila DSM 1495]EGS21505.1 hypothetical protein CTHT_0033630 [Thermochaetoides thermophila DSM 1495]
MPSKDQVYDLLQAQLQTKGIKFHIKTGGAKWECTLLDRNTHEKRKAERQGSTSSASSVTSSSSASTKSH